MTDNATPVFRIERVFAAPRQMVWDAWTVPEQYKQWFGPKGSRVELLQADIRVGGLIHSFMETPGGPMYGRGLYREVTPPSRLVYEHGFADAEGNLAKSPFPMDWPMVLLTTVVFEDEGDGTRMTLTWMPLDATPEQEATFAGHFESMNGGWGGSFDVLEEFLARK
jgi:uncharacterized protein YndB with AHSA1/START domain